MPQFRQVSSGQAAGGRKRVRLHGELVDYANENPPTHLDRAPRGRTIPDRVLDGRPNVDGRPISDKAEELLIEYYKRFSFWRMITDGADIGWAGQVALGCKKSRATKVLQEMKALHETGDPLRWFQEKAIRMMDDGQISRGRDTLRSSTADAFFTALAGGTEGLTDIAETMKDRRVVNLDEFPLARGLDQQVESEARDYLVYGRLMWRLED
jgi:hypothetical protein